ncbi:hypothetical protein [Hyphococcus luteus]|uniref:EF-hand domain-containing protein n=1 Tax=Hyphococcus luteus TaxID=2058213 RepID=A0A2S7JYS6_9PROT|nr:hypothetical protein [Marinicaulis flavus]PQA85404.1 hypothetical protein CW354_20885 [Marinicaulis flavus]
MAKFRFEIAAASLAALVFSGPAFAQEDAAQDESGAGEAPVALALEPAAEDAAGEPEEVNPDEMADQLNSSQQLKQTITLRRTVDGKLVETEKRTVTYDRNAPYRETEAGETTLERVKDAFDGEALTRTEAFEEAKLDFAIADANHDDKMTAEEFARLVESWRKNETRQADAPSEEIARQRQYDAFIAEIDPDTAQAQTESFAKQKFAFMAGAAETMSLKDYIREYMLDFDSMDEDKDMVLTDEELMRFRAINRGETLDM